MSGSATAARMREFADETRPENAPQDWIETAVDIGSELRRSVLAQEWTVSRPECDGSCGAGEFIQVLRVTPNAGHPFGQVMDGWWALVDAGRFSPWFLHDGRALPHQRMPYFYGPRRWRTDCSIGSLTFFDDPLSAFSHDEAYFETAAICIRHRGGRRDRLLRAVRWGWCDRGRIRRPSADEPDGDRIDTDILSDVFWRVLELEGSPYLKARLE